MSGGGFVSGNFLSLQSWWLSGMGSSLSLEIGSGDLVEAEGYGFAGSVWWFIGDGGGWWSWVSSVMVV